VTSSVSRGELRPLPWICSVFFAIAMVSAASTPWPATSPITMPISQGLTGTKS